MIYSDIVIQYSSIAANNIVGVSAQNENGVVLASPEIPSLSFIIAVQEISIAKKAEKGDEYEEDEDDEDDDESQMSDEEYLASKQHLFSLEIIK